MNTITWLGLASMLFVALFTWAAYNGSQEDGGQTRRESIIEAWVNIAIGFGINFTANLFILPMVGAHFTALENFWMGWLYTGISIIRSYTIRRFFNDRIHKFAAKTAERLA